jgi:predicted flap endonuclease-1-like 5' DNA nuclease
MPKIIEIEGIGGVYAKKLKEAGIKTVPGLLKKGATPQGRKEVAEKSDISDALILRWVNHSDLFRINGVGAEYAEILEASGVDSVPELAQRNPENLYQKLVAVNQERRLVRKLPSQAQVGKWIEEAKRLPRVVNY